MDSQTTQPPQEEPKGLQQLQQSQQLPQPQKIQELQAAQEPQEPHDHDIQPLQGPQLPGQQPEQQPKRTPKPQTQPRHHSTPSAIYIHPNARNNTPTNPSTPSRGGGGGGSRTSIASPLSPSMMRNVEPTTPTTNSRARPLPSGGGVPPFNHSLFDRAPRRSKTPVRRLLTINTTTTANKTLHPNQTCSNWAQGTCLLSEKHCPRPHFFFPTLIHRAHRGGKKTHPCDFQEECVWPEEVCGFSHRERKSSVGEGMREEENFNGRVEGMGWKAGMYLECKSCGMVLFVKDDGVAAVDVMQRHCQTVHPVVEAPLPSPSPFGVGGGGGRAGSLSSTRALCGGETGVSPMEREESVSGGLLDEMGLS